MRSILDLLTYFSKEGSWSLYSHESIILNAVIDSLDGEVQLLVKTQLEQKFFVQRIPNGMINIFHFYSQDDSLAIIDPDFSDLLFNVYMIVEGKKQIAHVTFYKGYLFSIEFRKAKSFYLKKEILVKKITIGKPNESHTVSINRLEHGSNK